MRVLCAPASFKETLTALRAAQAMAAGVTRADPKIVCDICPVGDGGEGTLDALLRAFGGRLHDETVLGPRGDPVNARFGVTNSGIAVIELAQASGLMLVPPDQRDPMKTTTFGTGQLIVSAMKSGCTSIIICIGGSATIDGGTGIAQALGFRFYDRSDCEISQRMCGELLAGITRIEPPQSKLPQIRVASDVTNPLCGPDGAAAVYGPQKGATQRQVQELDLGLMNLAEIAGGDPNQPGAGAAGGAGYGLAAMCNAQLVRGIDLVLDTIDFKSRCRGASLVLTGEGRLDSQSLQGKACMGVAAAAAALGVPTIAIVGSTGLGAEQSLAERGGFLRSYISLTERHGQNRAMAEAATLLSETAEDVVRHQPR